MATLLESIAMLCLFRLGAEDLGWVQRWISQHDAHKMPGSVINACYQSCNAMVFLSLKFVLLTPRAQPTLAAPHTKAARYSKPYLSPGPQDDRLCTMVKQLFING
jgi:hypothetical protein